MPTYLVALSIHVPDDAVEKYTDTTPEDWAWDELINPPRLIDEGIPRTDVSLLKVEEVKHES